jgi:hypothetical protein
MPITSVDPAALWAAAQRLDSAADVAAGAARPLGDPHFDGSAAGRAHAGSGWAVRAAVDALAADLNRWAHAARELAGALRAAAQQHAAAEAYGETVLR